MAEKDNTSPEVKREAPDITNQETLDAALQAEPVKAEAENETPDNEVKEVKPDLIKKELILGKYKSVDDLSSAYTSLQSQYTKTQQEIKELKKTMDGKSREEIKTLDYDKQLDLLLNELQELKEFKSNILESIEKESESVAIQSEEQAINDFIEKNPLLKESGLDDEFRLIATHPSLKDYTLDSIYSVRILPKIEKLMGKKITVKERKLVGGTTVQEPKTFNDVSTLSADDYEKHRAEILAGAGIK